MQRHWNHGRPAAGGHRRSQTPKLKGCQVIAAYRIKFVVKTGGDGAVVGTLEGVLVCFCSA